MRDIKVKIWIEEDRKVIFGEGRKQLLEAISQYGSIMKAAQALKISYRAAWGRLQASEERLGVKLVEKKIGRHDGKNTVLTEQGKQWLEKFNKLESALKKELETFEKQFQK